MKGDQHVGWSQINRMKGERLSNEWLKGRKRLAEVETSDTTVSTDSGGSVQGRDACRQL